jgi:hypothetical protein
MLKAMCVQRLKRAVYWAGAVFLLGACNQINTVLPSAGTYQVDAMNGQLPLNECSVIAAGDPILPYFVTPVINDPDLNSLVLYVEDGDRKVLGRRVLYTSDSPPARRNAGEEQEAGEAGPYGGDLTIPVETFSGKLPPFPLPEGLEIGAYSLIFEIRGEQDMLSRVNRPFYYIGERNFTAGDIRCYLPGLYENGHLVPQDLTVMLETELSYDEGLEPYVIWYNGKSRIGEGPVAAGAARMFWTPPPHPGFYTIRAELFPFEPRAGQKGRIKEFSLPVSQKTEDPVPAAGDYLYMYRFAGDLLESRTGMMLEGGDPEGPPPSWYATDQVYGLALGEGEAYEALSCSPAFSGGGELNFFIRFIPLKEGRIFGAALGSSLKIGLFAEEGALVLKLEGGGRESRISRALPESGRPAFSAVQVTVSLERTAARALLKLTGSTAPEGPGEEGPPEEGAEIVMDLPAGGELRSWIGAEGEKKPPEEGAVSVVPGGFPGQPPASSPPVLVVDDFAAMFGGRR